MRAGSAQLDLASSIPGRAQITVGIVQNDLGQWIVRARWYTPERDAVVGCVSRAARSERDAVQTFARAVDEMCQPPIRDAIFAVLRREIDRTQDIEVPPTR